MKIKKLIISEKGKRLLKSLSCTGCAVLLAGSLSACSFPPTSEIDFEQDNNHSYHYDMGANHVSVAYSTIVDEDIEELPSSITDVSMFNCHFVTSLSTLPDTCPDLSYLELDSCSSITDLSFIYRLSSLKTVILNDICGITPELIKYFKDAGIDYTISDGDVIASEKVQRILDEIITDDMSDSDKIKAISLYVSKNCKYNLDFIEESNNNPLEFTLLEGEGVCAGIAYTTNVLLRSAGITSYELVSDAHAWNMIEFDGKYYYLDVTNLGSVITKPLAQLVLKTLGVGHCYMSDPSRTTLTAMEQYDNCSAVIIPNELVEDIANGESEKNIIEKYASSLPLQIITGLIAIVGIGLGIKLAKTGIEGLQSSHQYRKRRKKS